MIPAFGTSLNGTLVQLQLNPHTGIVTLFTRLGKVPDQHRAAVNERLLDANTSLVAAVGSPHQQRGRRLDLDITRITDHCCRRW
jgi:hypothetical protein